MITGKEFGIKLVSDVFWSKNNKGGGRAQEQKYFEMITGVVKVRFTVFFPPFKAVIMVAGRKALIIVKLVKRKITQIYLNIHSI